MTQEEEALVNLWAARDQRYAYRRKEYLGVGEIEAVRIWRMSEARDINSLPSLRDASMWTPPQPMVQR